MTDILQSIEQYLSEQGTDPLPDPEENLFATGVLDLPHQGACRGLGA